MIDIIIAAVMVLIIAISAFIGMKKGFIRMIAGFVEYVVSFLLAYVFCSKLAVYVKKIPFIAKMVTDTEMPSLEGMTLGEKIKFVVDYIVDNVIAKGADQASLEAAAIVKNYIASIISTAIAFILIFVVTLLLQKLIVLLLDLAAKAPGLKQINGGLGFVFGLVCGSFWTWLLANIFVRAALPILFAKFPETFTEALASGAVITFFLKINPVSLVLNFLTWIADKFTK
jgi:uncharacterized membrane protein required for colicin V production